MSSHTAIVMLSEFGTPANRSYMMMANTIIDSSANLLIPIFFYTVGDWRVLVWANTLLVLVLIIAIAGWVP